MVHKTQKVSDMCRGDAKFLRYGIEPFYCRLKHFRVASNVNVNTT